MAARCQVLIDSITNTVWDYIRRGLFVRHKQVSQGVVSARRGPILVQATSIRASSRAASGRLKMNRTSLSPFHSATPPRQTVAVMIALKIATNDGWLKDEQVDYLVSGKDSSDPGNMGPLGAWLPEVLWPKIKALESLAEFKGIGDTMQSDSDDWKEWFSLPNPEASKMPSDYDKTLDQFYKLVFIRATRPDRTSVALNGWLKTNLGNNFVEQPPFDMGATFKETTNQTPVFFVLFPGVDPTGWVETLGKELGFTEENGNFRNISMGQGQEAPAESIVQRFAKDGGWIMLQNCHLMEDWVPSLERLLEVVQENAHKAFRCYVSAEAPSMDWMKNMPESLLQSCVKVSNEAPADVKSNLMRAWSEFSQDRIDASSKPKEYKGILFCLCYFHAVVCGRRGFGPQGWLRMANGQTYSYNTGDLTICDTVLFNYLDTNPGVPWQDLRYVFGEIMYGGHITDPFDRRTCMTYLAVYILPSMFEGLKLAPGVICPNFEELDFEGVYNYIETTTPTESPVLYGLHPNAEIGFLVRASEALFVTILQLSGGGGGGGGSGGGVRAVMNDLTERLPPDFIMLLLMETAAPHIDGAHAPFVVCSLQECTRMNTLLREMRRTLVDLDKGLKGQLNMTQPMEDMIAAFMISEWPGRNPFAKCTWEKNAWPSMKVPASLPPYESSLKPRHTLATSSTPPPLLPPTHHYQPPPV